MILGPKAQLRGPWEWILALALDLECARIGPYELYVSHGSDGWHSKKSRHYLLEAIDGWVVFENEPHNRADPSIQHELVARANDKLAGFSHDLDVILEDPGGKREHIHAERDPKGPVRL